MRAEASLSEEQALVERMLLLRQLPVMRQLDAAQLASFATVLTPVRFGAGETMVEEAEVPHHFYLVRDGLVRGERKGRDLGAASGPASVGLFPLLARSAGSIHLVAETEVHAYRIDEDHVHEAFEDHFTILLGMIRGLAESLLLQFQAVAELAGEATEVYEPVRSATPLSVVEKIAALRRMRPFAKASVASLARLAVVLDEVRLAPGELLWRRGEPGDFSLLLLDGAVEQVWDGGRLEVGPGFVLGGAEAVAGLVRSADARVVAPTLALRGSHARFVDAIEDSFDLALHFVSFLATAMIEYWDVRAAHGQRPMQDFVMPGMRPPSR